MKTLIDKLPFDINLPGGYQYWSPGIQLEIRLTRKDPGINKLDQSCKVHDIAYSQSKDLNERQKAAKILEEAASQRLKSTNQSFHTRKIGRIAC